MVKEHNYSRDKWVRDPCDYKSYMGGNCSSFPHLIYRELLFFFISQVKERQLHIYCL